MLDAWFAAQLPTSWPEGHRRICRPLDSRPIPRPIDDGEEPPARGVRVWGEETLEAVAEGCSTVALARRLALPYATAASRLQKLSELGCVRRCGMTWLSAAPAPSR